MRQLLLSRHIRYQRSVPYNHSIGTSEAESTVRYIKRLQRLANAAGKLNPALKHLGYTELDIDRSWGETFHWAVTLLLTRPAWNNPSITRYEAGTGHRFNIQTIPLLPIFSSLLAWHHGQKRYVHCLYVGPAWDGIMAEPSPGAIRAMYKSSTTPGIFITTTYKCVTSGANINLEQAAQRSVGRMLADAAEMRASTDVHADTSLIDAVEVRATTTVPADTSTVTVGGEQRAQQEYGGDGVSDGGDGVSEGEADYRVTATTEPHSKEKRSRSRRRKVRSKVIKSVSQRETSSDQNQKEEYSKQYRPSTRSERYGKRESKAESMFVDWTNSSDSIYYCYDWDKFVSISDYCAFNQEVVKDEIQACTEYGYRAVTENVPKSWSAAIKHPQWRDAARLEKDRLLEKSIVMVPREVALEAVRQGADIVNLFPVFEEKLKEGKTVYKVRLVGDGRSQQHAGATYSETPSREEFRILMHLIGRNGWDFYHSDEKRAFLNAPFIGSTPVFARLGLEYY